MIGPNMLAKRTRNVAHPRPRQRRTSGQRPSSARFIAAEKIRKEIEEMRWMFVRAHEGGF